MKNKADKRERWFVEDREFDNFDDAATEAAVASVRLGRSVDLVQDRPGRPLRVYFSIHAGGPFWEWMAANLQEQVRAE